MEGRAVELRLELAEQIEKVEARRRDLRRELLKCDRETMTLQAKMSVLGELGIPKASTLLRMAAHAAAATVAPIVEPETVEVLGDASPVG
jgi:hypothetical protein